MSSLHSLDIWLMRSRIIKHEITLPAVFPSTHPRSGENDQFGCYGQHVATHRVAEQVATLYSHNMANPYCSSLKQDIAEATQGHHFFSS